MTFTCDTATTCGCVSRRGLFAGLGALALGGTAAAQTAAPHRIDVHHHLSPPAYIQRLSPRMPLAPVQVNWTVAKTLDDMDRNGTATAILTVATPGFWFGNVQEARDLVRASNDYAATLVRDNGRRFGMFAALPLPDAEGSLVEIAYGLDTLRADGIGLYTSYENKWLGDPAFTPVLEELNRRRAVVYVHPVTNACCGNLLPGVPDNAIEFGTDTTRTIASLVFTGAAQRFADIRWIFSHAGGTMPFLIERFDFLAASGPNRQRFPQGVRQYLRGFHYDLAQSANPSAVGALRIAAPVSQMLYGTDFPYRTSEEHVRNIATAGFSAEELALVERGNAQRLMPRFA